MIIPPYELFYFNDIPYILKSEKLDNGPSSGDVDVSGYLVAGFYFTAAK
jgi:hypothetical protein